MFLEAPTNAQNGLREKKKKKRRPTVTINKVRTCQGISPERMCCASKIKGDRGGRDVFSDINMKG